MSEAGHLHVLILPTRRQCTQPHSRAVLGQRRDRRAGWLAEAISTRLTPAEQQALADVLPLLGRLAAH
ncbi:MAG TPA: hypothetical protein VNW94_01530 [Streptosporangiaceae bacterium]|nr:hypothetical protein [Streptosporangiaceae bacterium]